MVKPKGGLGKGLGALIPLRSQPTTEVSIDSIVPNPLQPRHYMDEAGLEELASSIRELGVIQPLVVSQTLLRDEQLPGTPKYQLIAGERRWQAARRAGLTSVPVVLKEATPQQALQIALVENIQRSDLTALEEAAAYRQLVDEFGLTQEEVASRVGKSRVAVTNALRLLGLGDEVKAALAAGHLTEGHARALLALEDAEEQVATLGVVLRRRLTVRQTEEVVRRLKRLAEVTPTRRHTAETSSLEDEFRLALGTRVSLFRSKRGGKLVIHFYNDEQLQALYDTLIASKK
ncbi:MAG: ParB/RepB/Spo0J family partition protein [Chloroflexi bacterium]|nr:ParB/RepB/Spo0J family partition protein [Chloroflexota bacterium]